DPHIAVDPALVVFGVADVHRHSVVRRVFIAGAPHLGLLLALVFHIHAVPAPDALLRGGLADDEPVHVLDAGVDAGLRGELLRMQHRHFLFAYRVVGPLPVVPGHQEAYAALDGDRPLRLVVDGLEGQAVQLAAQPVLDLVCQPLVLLPPRRHFGGGDGRRHLAFDVLEDDVPHVRRVLRAPVRLRVALHQRPQLPVSVVQVLPPVHALHLRLPGCVAVRQPLLPNIQFCRPDCRFSRFHRVLLSPRGTPEFQQVLPPLGVRPVEVVPHILRPHGSPRRRGPLHAGPLLHPDLVGDGQCHHQIVVSALFRLWFPVFVINERQHLAQRLVVIDGLQVLPGRVFQPIHNHRPGDGRGLKAKGRHHLSGVVVQALPHVQVRVPQIL
ncbi:ABC-2 family transporter protein, partial [Dysosmobacter welbionis]